MDILLTVVGPLVIVAAVAIVLFLGITFNLNFIFQRKIVFFTFLFAILVGLASFGHMFFKNYRFDDSDLYYGILTAGLQAFMLIFFFIFGQIAFVNYFVRNKRGAYWWIIVTLVSICLCTFDYKLIASDSLTATILTGAIPLGVYFIGGILLSNIVPKSRYKDINQRNHVTNCDLLLGQLVYVQEPAVRGMMGKGTIGNQEWKIISNKKHGSLPLGFYARVLRIQGTTLICKKTKKSIV